MQFVNIGYNNIIATNRIIAIVTPDAAPTKRLIQEARQKMLVIDRNSRKENKSSNYNGHGTYNTLSSTTRHCNRKIKQRIYDSRGR